MVGRNATALLTARVITAIGNLGLAALVATRLGSAGFGTFAALLAGGAIANLAITFGVDLVVVRAVAAAEVGAGSTVRHALLLQILGASLLFMTAGAAVVAGASPLILLPAATLYPMGLTTVASAVLRGAQQMQPIPGAALASSLVAIAAAALFVSDGIWVAVAAVSVGQIVGAAVLATAAVPFVPRRAETPTSTATSTPAPAGTSTPAATSTPASAGTSTPAPEAADTQPHPLVRLLGESWVFAIATVATTVMIQGSLIVYETVGSGDGGGLAAGIRLAETARMVPAAAFAALFPAMFDGVHRSPRYQRLFLAMVAYAIVAAAVLSLFAPLLSDLVFDDPADGTLVIRILAVGLVATVFRLRYSFELIAKGQERTVLRIAACAAAAALIGYGIGAVMDSVVVVALVQLGAAVATAAALAGASRRTVEPRPAGTG